MYATIGGGWWNWIEQDAPWATIGGGTENIINPGASGSAIAGGILQWIGVGASNTFIGGGFYNYVESPYSTVAGGSQNQIEPQSPHAAILGGSENAIGRNARYAVIGGGQQNAILTNAPWSTIGGGRQNSIRAHAQYATIGGGTFNIIEAALYTMIGGGGLNIIYTNAHYSTIMGGGANSIRTNAQYATIAGGRANRVGPNATNAFAAGRQAVANHRGAFVWGDDTSAEIASTTINQVTFRASSGYRIFSNSGATLGAQLFANATAWSVLSDREAKENFAPIQTAEILTKLAALPLAEWSYRDDPTHRRYIGPVAQDFHAAFGLGDDTTISTLDADGVALAAIQALAKKNDALGMMNAALEKKVSDFSVQVSELEKENGRLHERLEALERRMGL